MLVVGVVIIVLLILVYIIIRMNQPNVLAYVLYHDERSEKIARIFKKYRWATFYKLGRDKYFESAFWPALAKKELEWFDKEYVGMISYSLPVKQHIFYFPMEKIIRDANGADVIAFYKLSPNGMVSHALRYHKRFAKVWTILLGKLGYSNSVSLSRDIPFFPCNCWVAKPVWMRQFLKFAKQALFLMENDEEIKRLSYLNCEYRGKMSKANLLQISGKPYYTCHPFIMERLPCFFFWVKGAKIYGTDIGFHNFYH